MSDKRVCLKCRKDFKSDGPGNRICNSCNNNNRKYNHNIIKVTPENRSSRPFVQEEEGGG